MIEYTKERPLRVATAFSGYDSQKMALERLHKVFPVFCYELVAWSEINENAITAHNAVFPEDKDKNLGDISKIDWSKAPNFDLLTYSFPCQDISSSGKQRGFEEGTGTRSSLLWECKKAIEAKKPRFLMMENVKAIVSAKFLPFLRQWQTWLHQQGYENFAQVLNASDYNVPQNRERVFMISILRTDDEPNPSFYFPKKMKLERRIKDILEPNVDESFYLSEKKLEYFFKVNNVDENASEKTRVGKISNSQGGVVSGINAIAPTLTAGHANHTKILSCSRDSEKGKVKSRHLKDLANTITKCTSSGNNCDQYVAEPNILEMQELRMIDGCMVNSIGRWYRIRNLTPKESFRLMDVDDNDIEKMKQAGIAKTNLYKLAGNSIVVSCMFHLFRKLFIEKNNENQQLELF